MKKLCLVAIIAALTLSICATCNAYCDGVECIEPTRFDVVVRDVNMALASGDWQGMLADIAANYGCYDLATVISSL